jgi:hypothetical protein
LTDESGSIDIWLPEELIAEDVMIRQMLELESRSSYIDGISSSDNLVCYSCGENKHFINRRKSQSHNLDDGHSPSSHRSSHSSNEASSPNRDQEHMVHHDRVPQPPKQSRERTRNGNLERRQRDTRSSRMKTPTRPGKFNEYRKKNVLLVVVCGVDIE